MYIVIFVEVVCIMGSSSIWRILSFKRTHLAERMGLLTLIITGEGIIVMMKAVNAVEKGKTLGGGWNPTMFTIVAAAVMIIVSPLALRLWVFIVQYHRR